MMTDFYSIDSYQLTPQDKLFFDANVWIYICSPIGNYNWNIVQKYDRFLKRALQVQAEVYISSLVLSEFFNRSVRIEFGCRQKTDPQKYQNFKKDFRNTASYNQIAKVLHDIIKKQILKIGKVIDDGFSEININRLFDDPNNYDFNDRYYQELAEIKNLKIVTNDADFAVCKLKIPIITANYKLLKGIV
ncbi:MAG: PIN domain-containing protein [Bacillota bacterium]|jgi:predicted nucleic acid-binding protein